MSDNPSTELDFSTMSPIDLAKANVHPILVARLIQAEGALDIYKEKIHTYEEKILTYKEKTHTYEEKIRTYEEKLNSARKEASSAVQLWTGMLEASERNSRAMEVKYLFVRGQLHARECIEKFEAKIKSRNEKINRLQLWERFLKGDGKHDNTEILAELLKCPSIEHDASPVEFIAKNIQQLYSNTFTFIRNASESLNGDFELLLPESTPEIQLCILKCIITKGLKWEGISYRRVAEVPTENVGTDEEDEEESDQC